MKKALIYFLIAIMLLSVCSCKVKPQSEEIANVAADSGVQTKQESTEQSEEKQTLETAPKQVTLTENTDNHFEKIDLKSEKGDPTSTSRTITLDGKEINLKFSEKINVCNSWYQYNYVDSTGVVYMFHEDDGFVGIYNPISPERSVPTTVDESQAVQIAKNYASKLFGDEFDDYVLLKSSTIDFMGPEYVFRFFKKYGSDNCLTGENCLVEIYRNGQIKRCYIRDLYAFKDFNASIVAGITKDDIEKAVEPLLARDYKNIEERDVVIDSIPIQYARNKWVIFVNITLTYKQSMTEAKASYCFDINY